MENRYSHLLKPDESLLIVIDLQEKFVPPLQQARDVVRASSLMLQAAAVMNVPVILTEHNSPRIGGTVSEIREAAGNSAVVEKHVFSALSVPEVLEKLNALPAVKNLVLCGCESHVCVCQTCLAALRAGYNVHVAADAVSSRLAVDRRVGLQRMQAAGAVISSAEMFSYELLRGIDHPGFKAMLPYFKGWTERQADGV